MKLDIPPSQSQMAWASMLAMVAPQGTRRIASVLTSKHYGKPLRSVLEAGALQ